MVSSPKGGCLEGLSNFTQKPPSPSADITCFQSLLPISAAQPLANIPVHFLLVAAHLTHQLLSLCWNTHCCLSVFLPFFLSAFISLFVFLFLLFLSLSMLLFMALFMPVSRSFCLCLCVCLHALFLFTLLPLLFLRLLLSLFLPPPPLSTSFWSSAAWPRSQMK